MRLLTLPLVVVALALSAGCENDDGITDSSTTKDAPGAVTGTGAFEDLEASLEVTYTRTGKAADEVEFRVECPAEEPAAATRCAALQADPQMFDEPEGEGEVACTEQYGGPEEAHVRGTINDDEIDTTLTRTDGCEISRWNRAAPVLTPQAKVSPSDTPDKVVEKQKKRTRTLGDK